MALIAGVYGHEHNHTLFTQNCLSTHTYIAIDSQVGEGRWRVVHM